MNTTFENSKEQRLEDNQVAGSPMEMQK